MDIDECRKEIDEIDSKILRLIGGRFEVCKEIGKIKKENSISLRDKNRERQVIDMQIANNKNLSPDFVRNLFGVIFKESIKLQNDN